MNKRKDEDMEKIVSNLGYFLLEDYFQDKRRRIIFRDDFGYKYDVLVSNLIRGHVPEIFRHTNSFSLENISLWINSNNKDFKLIEDNQYLNNSSPLYFYCYICNDIFKSSWNKILRGSKCVLCNGSQVGNKNNLKYLRPDLANEWSPKNRITPKEVTISSGKVIIWKCSKCKYEWKTRVADRSSGRGCPACCGQVLTDLNRLSIKFPELSFEWDFNKNKNITPDNVSYGSSKKVWWKCKKCDGEWIASVSNRTKIKSGCPICASIKKESRVAIELKEFLKNKGIDFISEYRILRNPKTNTYLPYDIYIPIKNIFIEIQGEQHYEINGYHRLGAKRKNTTQKKEFKYQKYKDKIKKKFAEKNGIYIEIDIRENFDFEKIIKLIKNNHI